MEVLKTTLFLMICFGLSKGCDGELSRKCKDKFESCIFQRISGERTESIGMFCCDRTLNNGSFSYKEYKNCQKERYILDIKDCFDKMDFKCLLQFRKHFAKARGAEKQFQKEVKKAVQKPKSKEQCEDYLMDRVEEVLIKCNETKEKELRWLCDMKETNLHKTKHGQTFCLDTLGQCLVDVVSKKTLQKSMTGCCKKAVKSKNGFVERYMDCGSVVSFPYFMECLSQSRMPRGCVTAAMGYLGEHTDAIKIFIERTYRLAKIPIAKDDCERFQNNVEKIALKRCDLNRNGKLTWYCDVAKSILTNPLEEDEGNES